jgi:hypothetical protein
MLVNIHAALRHILHIRLHISVIRTEYTPLLENEKYAGGGRGGSPPASFQRKEEIVVKFDSLLLGHTPCLTAGY